MSPPFALWLVVAFLTPSLSHATIITNDTSIAANQTFDYIIVGAGLTGLTVANKLTQDGRFSTLIIEAGPDPSWNPGVYNAGDRKSVEYCNWLYPAYDENGTVLDVAVDSGACVGGSTSINGMVWIRPTAQEVNKLEELGNPGWNWEVLEPYMTAIESNIPPTELQILQGAGLDPSVHGFNGLINVSFPTPMRIPKAVSLYKEALPQTFPSLQVTDDLSNRSASTETVSASTSWTIWYDPATNKNRRSSAADGLLWAESQHRKHLTVLVNHKADKIIFDKDTRAAKGVRFGTKPDSNVPGSLPGIHTAFASREVILAAGALASASVLERSGIGNEVILKAAGVPELLVDLPGVGSNLVDQPGTSISALVAEALWNDTGFFDEGIVFAPEISLVNGFQLWPGASEFFHDKLTAPGSLEERAKALVSAGAAANIEGAMAILNVTIDLIVNNQFPVAEFVAESFPTSFSSVFWPLMPLSRGYVHINSTDPFVNQRIVPRFLTDLFDQEVAVTIAKRAGRMYDTAPAFANIVTNAYYDLATLNGASTDDEWFAWYKETSYGASHWMGSTAMLPRELGGVVDSELRVYGTQRLRLVDAGVIPFELTSHPMPMLYATAQKAAALILAEGL